MAIIKCQNGHFFDNKKSQTCPICDGGCQKDDRLSKTVWLEKLDISNETEDMTVGVYSDFKGNDFVVGWIVCVTGPDKGRDYRLHQGYNRIGRDYSMDISPTNDLQISRGCHCSIVYEDRKNLFYFIPESGSVSYLNQELVEDICKIYTGDKFQIGKSEFEFVAFCREGRSWTE